MLQEKNHANANVNQDRNRAKPAIVALVSIYH